MASKNFCESSTQLPHSAACDGSRGDHHSMTGGDGHVDPLVAVATVLDAGGFEADAGVEQSVHLVTKPSGVASRAAAGCRAQPELEHKITE
jgi:hypothetical protein